MAFENVDIDKIKIALNSCKDAINHSTSNNLVSEIMNSDIWYCDSRNNLKNALSQLLELYKILENEINFFLEKFQRYKEYEEEIEELERKYADLEGRLWVEEEYEDYDINPETGEREYYTVTETVKDLAVEREMNRIRQEINEILQKMESLRQQIVQGSS